MKMDSNQIKKILKDIPLRISITDYCNLNCFFCSNEGMHLGLKNTTEIDFDNLIYFLRLLRRNGLEKISITGGDPTNYTKLEDLLRKINDFGFKKVFFHTNGVLLNENLILGELKKFDKIAISIHSLNFNEWKKMTGGKKDQFNKILKNLELMSNEGFSKNVEIKIVLVRGINDSKTSIKNILEFCEKNNFRFKFLILEPIKENHKKLIFSLNEMSNLLKEIGAQELLRGNIFRNQTRYLPINKYKYKSTEGVLIEIGCGKKETCKACSDSNEIFITPKLEIKPCHISPYMIDLSEAIKDKNKDKILNLLLKSRCFLKTCPGENKKYWGQD